MTSGHSFRKRYAYGNCTGKSIPTTNTNREGAKQEQATPNRSLQIIMAFLLKVAPANKRASNIHQHGSSFAVYFFCVEFSCFLHFPSRLRLQKKKALPKSEASKNVKALSVHSIPGHDNQPALLSTLSDSSETESVDSSTLQASAMVVKPVRMASDCLASIWERSPENGK